MKIIISETQNKFLIESKNLGATQTLVDMVMDDYVGGCAGATVFNNLTFAMCQGLKKGSIEVKVIDVDPFYEKIENKKVLFFMVKLSLIVDQKWFEVLMDSDYEKFENNLSFRADNIIGSLKYFFTVDDKTLLAKKRTHYPVSVINELDTQDELDSNNHTNIGYLRPISQLCAD